MGNSESSVDGMSTIDGVQTTIDPTHLIQTIQPLDSWTVFCDSLAQTMFDDLSQSDASPTIPN